MGRALALAAILSGLIAAGCGDSSGEPATTTPARETIAAATATATPPPVVTASPTSTRTREPRPSPTPLLEERLGVEIRELTLLQPAPLPDRWQLIAFHGPCFGCGFGPGDSRLWERGEHGEAVGRPLLETLTKGNHQSVASLAIGGGAQELAAVICTVGYCGGEGDPSPGSEAALYGSHDGGASWQLVGEVAPETTLIGFSDGELLLQNWVVDGAGHYVFSFRTLNAPLLPPRGEAADWVYLFPDANPIWLRYERETQPRVHFDDGGSVAAPAGNIFTWRVVYGPNGVMEVRKFRKAMAIGFADFQSGIDRGFMGTLPQAPVCNASDNYYGYHSFRALGVVIHLTGPCTDQPFCYGQWETQNADHWLWADSGLSDGDLFGTGRESSTGRPTFAVGHESDTWRPGMPLPGLAPGQQPVILGEGTGFDPDDPGGRNDSFTASVAYGEEPSCREFAGDLLGEEGQKPDKAYAPTRSDTILYFPHVGGGHVLVIGASATPWALASDDALSGLLQRGLDCFAFGEACGQ